MKLTKRITSACTILLCFLIVALLAGCTTKTSPQNNVGNDGGEYVTENGVYPILKEEYKDTKLTMMGLGSPLLGTDWANHTFFKRMTEYTGVDWNYNVYNAASYSSNLSMTFVNPDTMPDVLFKAFLPQAFEVKYGKLGLLIPLEDLIAKYAPNLNKVLEDNPAIKAMITAPDGHIYALPSIGGGEDSLNADGYFWINKKWLNNLNLEMPQTADELKTVLRAFKTQDPNGNGINDENPMMLIGGADVEALYAIFGLNTTSYNCMINDQKQTYFLPSTENYKEALKFMRDLYAEGLMNQNYLTISRTQMWAKGAESDCIGIFYDAGPALVVGQDRASDYVALQPMTSNVNDEKMWAGRYDIGTGCFAITSNCKSPALAMRWIDCLYSEPCNNWVIAGKENEEWVWDDAEHTSWSYTFDTNNFSSVINSATIQDYGGNPYLSPAYTGFWQKQTNVAEKIKIEEVGKIRPYYKLAYPPVFMKSTDVSSLATISNDIGLYVSNMSANVIAGNMDIDKEWENINKQYKKLRVDKYVETLQRLFEESPFYELY